MIIRVGDDNLRSKKLMQLEIDFYVGQFNFCLSIKIIS